jgi:hypothetical protein
MDFQKFVELRDVQVLLLLGAVLRSIHQETG